MSFRDIGMGRYPKIGLNATHHTIYPAEPPSRGLL